MTPIEKEFVVKLRNLLDEYGAEIHWDCDPSSDTHGINGERMEIVFRGNHENIAIPYQNWISPCNLNELL